VTQKTARPVFHIARHMIRCVENVTQSRDLQVGLRRFGGTDLRVSEFGLGCARLGGIFNQDVAEHLNLLSAAFDAGINFFDTADMYSQGESEVLLGRAFRRRREQVVIASKAGFVLPAQRRIVGRIKPLVRPIIRLLRLRRHQLPGGVRGTLAQDFSTGHLRRAVEGSLIRLRTDRLDLFQLHSPSTAVLERGEWREAVDRLRQEGKIRYYGVSCDSVDAALAALAYAGVSSLQFPINLLEQRAVAEVLPRARKQGVAVIARECLANGVLAKDASAIDLTAYCQSPQEAELRAAQLVLYRRLASENGCTLAQLALHFVSRLDGVSLSLVGVSRLQQINELISAGILSAQRPDLRIPHFA
jgi:aryl-alcohol dehydrogenase-like predicted oxidoreductase